MRTRPFTKFAAGGRGKTEMWHIVSAEPGAQVLLGLKPGVDKRAFIEGLERNTLEPLFQPYDVHAGDTIFVPAGTPHTIGPNMVICEVQEYSDLTYRVYDFGRLGIDGKPRELHIDKALHVTNFGPCTAEKPHVPPARRTSGRVLCWLPVRSSLLNAGNSLANYPLRYLQNVSLEAPGNSRRQWSYSLRNLSLPYQAGECWLIPASLSQYSLHAEQGGEHGTMLIRTYVPDVEKLAAELKQTGIPQGQLARTVFV